MVQDFAQITRKALRFSVLLVIVLVVPLFLLLVIRGPFDGEGDTTEGYWGPKTSTVNWCEADYTVTVYVAEFTNTISSLVIVCNGLYGIYRHYGHVEIRYIWAFAGFIVVGFGSAAFHGTLWRSMQLMDELPMVCVSQTLNVTIICNVHFMS
jgi:hypothetical protein